MIQVPEKIVVALCAITPYLGQAKVAQFEQLVLGVQESILQFNVSVGNSLQYQQNQVHCHFAIISGITAAVRLWLAGPKFIGE